MRLRWRLRMAAAEREVWTGAQLRRLLAERADLELSAASISELMSKQPAHVKVNTLAALCTALDCTPNDLFEEDSSPPPEKSAHDRPPRRRARRRSMPPI